MKLNSVWSKAIAACADRQRAKHFYELIVGSVSRTALRNPSAEQARILAALFSGSEALSTSLTGHPAWLALLKPDALKFGRRKEGLAAEVKAWLQPLLEKREYESALAKTREFKQRELLRIGARDLARLANVQEIIRELSDVAEVCLESVWQICLRRLTERHGKPFHQDPEGKWHPTSACVLGMGKLGGQELNYSSDVDVLFVYEEEGKVLLDAPRSNSVQRPGLTNHQFYCRLAEAFIAEVSRMTPEGMLYRIDLRLRPEGDSGPLARSLASYENYYVQWGQTWERMMMIKARGVAGSQGLAAEFLEMVQPFRYPRSVGTDVLREVAAMKDRIENEVVKAGELDRNVKLGKGGIREVEFVTQALQLLHAGRQPFLQGAQTVPALAKLAQYELLGQKDADLLRDSYCFLRDIEHRLQMEANLQTHTIPSDPKAQERLARLMGFSNRKQFGKARQTHTAAVSTIFEKVLKGGKQTGVAESPFPQTFEGKEAEWKRVLAEHGFREVEKAFRVLREFVEGPGYVHVSTRTNELALKLLPRVLRMGGERQESGVRSQESEGGRKIARPHPGPLPQGEGADLGRRAKARPRPAQLHLGKGGSLGRRSKARPHPGPLPRGEGADQGRGAKVRPQPDQLHRGEGEGRQAVRLSDPDRVVTRLDSFIAAYGARGTLFELWNSNPTIFDLLVMLFDRSEFLAELAIRTPDLVDELVTSGRLRQRKTSQETLEDLRHGIKDADQHAWLRRYHQTELMRIGLRDILGLADEEQYLVELSGLADACLQYALGVVMRRHKLKSPPFAIIGLGKLGGAEIDYGSDLDILFVTGSEGAKGAAGKRRQTSSNRGNEAQIRSPMRPPGKDQSLVTSAATVLRMAVEVMDLLSARTELGLLFHTDARLRPDGEKGLLVNSLGAYEEYYRQRAALWEIQSLTRTRAVAGDKRIGAEFQALAGTLTNFKKPSLPLAAYTPQWKEKIHAMRMRIEKERTPAGKDDLAIKTGKGGLVDAEFVAQVLCLENGWQEANTIESLKSKVRSLRLEGRSQESGAGSQEAGRRTSNIERKEKQDQKGLRSPALSSPRLRMTSARQAGGEGEAILTQMESLIEHYRKLRRVEGILRRWSYEGETVLPDDPAPYYRVAVRCGFETAEEFREAVAMWRMGIREGYLQVFGAGREAK